MALAVLIFSEGFALGWECLIWTRMYFHFDRHDPYFIYDVASHPWTKSLTLYCPPRSLSLLHIVWMNLVKRLVSVAPALRQTGLWKYVRVQRFFGFKDLERYGIMQLSPNFLARLFLVPKVNKWYFVTKIVLTYCEKKLF